MRLCKELLVVLYVFIFLLNDPQLVRACMADTDTISAVQTSESALDLFMGESSSGIHLVYVLNGGTNSNYNPEEIDPAELPVVLDVPVRDGYNFAGWYTDSTYTNKITEINQENAANMVLFAKWTRVIDNTYNVEMYSYTTGSVVSQNQKELKSCSYTFLDNIEIPGMPSTREQDYLDNIITCEGQCL